MVLGCSIFIFNVRPLSQAEGFFFSNGESSFKGFGGYLSIDVDLSATVRSTTFFVRLIWRGVADTDMIVVETMVVCCHREGIKER